MSRQTSSDAEQSGRLLSLVDELLLNIIDQVDSHQALCNLAATCTRFQGLVEPYVWRSLLVLNGPHARNIALALDNREERAEYIQALSIRYKHEHRRGIEDLNYFIPLMRRLRHVIIESPCPNNTEWRDVALFDGYTRIDYANLLAGAVYPRLGLPLALPVLQSLTLHGHGPANGKFDLGRAQAMFLHPTLRNITFSCLDFAADMSHEDDLVKEKQKCTPLQSLTIIECNVNIQFLDVVLSLPKALKELSIGERLHTFPECEPSMDPSQRTSSPLFLTALQRQARSLRRLVHIGGQPRFLCTRQTDPEGAAKFRSLISLEHLELGFESHLYYYLRRNGFPPSLKTLKMLDAAISINVGDDLRALSNIAFNSITSLVTDHLFQPLPTDFLVHLHFSDHPIFRLFITAYPPEQNHLLSTLFLDRPAIYKIARILKTHNAHFHISRETFPSGTGYIPPYMYGEDLPVEEAMYDSDDYWRFSGIDYQIMDDERLREEMKGQKQLATCVRCSDLGVSVDECRGLGDGSACLPCRRARSDCLWVRRADGVVGDEVDGGVAETSGEVEI